MLSEHETTEHGALNSVIIIHGNNDVTVAHIAEPTLEAVQQIAADQSTQGKKVVGIIGGIVSESGERERYIKLPVLAVCSSARHANERKGKAAAMKARDLTIDFHTCECPIELTAHNAAVSLTDAGVADCAIDGVLDIYAVQRWISDLEKLSQGKAGIFKRCAAWEHPHGHQLKSTSFELREISRSNV